MKALHTIKENYDPTAWRKPKTYVAIAVLVTFIVLFFTSCSQCTSGTCMTYKPVRYNYNLNYRR